MALQGILPHRCDERAQKPQGRPRAGPRRRFRGYQAWQPPLKASAHFKRLRRPRCGLHRPCDCLAALPDDEAPPPRLEPIFEAVDGADGVACDVDGERRFARRSDQRENLIEKARGFLNGGCGAIGGGGTRTVQWLGPGLNAHYRGSRFSAIHAASESM